MIRSKEEFLEIVKKYHKSQTGEYSIVTNPIDCDMKCAAGLCIFRQGKVCNVNAFDKIDASKKTIRQLEDEKESIDKQIELEEDIIASCDRTICRADEWNKYNVEPISNSDHLNKLAEKCTIIKSIKIQSAKDKGYNMYVSSAVEDLPWQAKPARVVINFKSYEDMINWLNSDYKEDK